MSTRSPPAPGALDPETSMRARLKTLTTITAVLVALTAIFVAGAPAVVRRQRRRRPSLRVTVRRAVHEFHARALVAGAAGLFVVVGVLFHGAASPAAAGGDEAVRPAAPVLQLAAASKTSVPTPAPVVAPIVAAAIPEVPVVKAFDPNDLIWPVHAPIWSGFGRRPGEFHTGIDLGAPSGTPIAAANSGVVIFAGWESGYGQETRIDHGGGIVTVYAHQSKLLVSAGQHVDQGQIIGKVGATGRVTAAHLHFEVRVNGAPQNPMRWLQNAN